MSNLMQIDKARQLGLNKKRLDLFFYTMYERQQIWYKRFILNLPQGQWTTDEYYQKYRFTNVYRELDRASQFLIKNIILNTDCWHKYKSDDSNNLNLIWKVLFFRTLNNPRIFESVDVIDDYGKYNSDKFYAYLKNNVIANNIPIQHGAFLQYSRKELTDESGKLIQFENNSEYFAKFVLKKLHDKIKDLYNKLKESFNAKDQEESAYSFIRWMSKNIWGAGKFMAHEFFQDLCYIKEYASINIMSYDANSATNAGPGSTGGAKYIFNNVKYAADVIDAIKFIKEISEECLNDIQKERFKDSDGFYYIAWNKDQHKYVRTTFNFTLNQIEMWLCEYYKYVKYIDSDGYAKMRKYNDIKSSNELLY